MIEDKEVEAQEDEELAAIVKERQRQQTVPVDWDDLE